jgi:Putative transposase of IS4/5 family (DUF4096)
VSTAIVYVLTSGCAWRCVPTQFAVSPATAHRRSVAWTEAGLWRRLHRAVLDRLGEQAVIDRSRAVVGRGWRAGERRGSLTGSTPVRGKVGAELHVLTETAGLPPAVATWADNTHDSLVLIRWCRPSPPCGRDAAVGGADRASCMQAWVTRSSAYAAG